MPGRGACISFCGWALDITHSMNDSPTGLNCVFSEENVVWRDLKCASYMMNTEKISSRPLHYLCKSIKKINKNKYK